MQRIFLRLTLAGALIGLAILPAAAQPAPRSLEGAAAYGDWREDQPGTIRHITATDLPPPYATGSAGNTTEVAKPPAGAKLAAPPGFHVTRFAEDLEQPRFIAVSPNGDIFVAESEAGRIRVLRAADGAEQAQKDESFAAALDAPFGIAFYPPGPDPRWVYIAETNAVLRFPYRVGDLKASGRPETIIERIARSGTGHWTRDLVFSPDGKRMFVSVGSASNVAEGMRSKRPDDMVAWEEAHGMGAGWGAEEGRADVLAFDPDGHARGSYANGLRNCVGMAIEPQTGELWCSTNERDGMGDNLPPDYVTRVREGAFYGWPWYYIGDHEDPRHPGERPDLRGKMTVPDVLLQPHSAPLAMTFYDGAGGSAVFPAAYRGDAFVALHGSWNRAKRTGYKIVRIRLANGAPTGQYEDFVTGFVIDDDRVWGRPVGVAVAHDGALLFSEDGNGTIWRVAYKGAAAQ